MHNIKSLSYIGMYLSFCVGILVGVCLTYIFQNWNNVSIKTSKIMVQPVEQQTYNNAFERCRLCNADTDCFGECVRCGCT